LGKYFHIIRLYDPLIAEFYAKIIIVVVGKKKDLTFDNHFQLFGRFKTINHIKPSASIHYFSIVKRLILFSINNSNKKQMYKYYGDR